MKTAFVKILIFGLSVLALALILVNSKYSLNLSYTLGQPIDSLNGVKVYYNGSVNNEFGRNLAADDYNLGLKYQCVEFVKRYYYVHFNHKMPESMGNAKDFYDKELIDGERNKKRGLIQYSNPSKIRPQVDDLLVFSETHFNKFGHVAIIAKVTNNKIEIIQQKPGRFCRSRETFSLVNKDEKWKINNNRILGWLRKE